MDTLNISIDIPEDIAKSLIYCLGQDSHPVSQQEQTLFHIEDKNLKDLVYKYTDPKLKPDGAHVRPPAMAAGVELYGRYGWPPVTATVTPKSAKIISFKSQPVALAEQLFENKSTKSATYSVTLSQSVTNTFSSSWSNSDSISISKDIGCEVTIEIMKASSKTTLSYSHTWSKSETKSTSTTIGTASTISVTLGPGQKARAVLSANRGFLKVLIEYEIRLSGSCATNFGKPYKGHYFWGMPIVNIMSANKLETVIIAREEITFDFYSSGEVVLYDANDGILNTHELADMPGIDEGGEK